MLVKQDVFAVRSIRVPLIHAKTVDRARRIRSAPHSHVPVHQERCVHYAPFQRIHVRIVHVRMGVPVRWSMVGLDIAARAHRNTQDYFVNRKCELVVAF